MIRDEFGISEKEYQTIQETLESLKAQGHKILPVTVKMLRGQGLAGKDTIFIAPNSNLEQLAWTVRHEIGHHNEPEDFVTFSIWNGEKCAIENWQEQAQEISKQATKNPNEFWAEKFAQEH